MVNSLIDFKRSCSILIFISFYCVIWINANSEEGLRHERSLRPLNKYILHHEPLSYNSKIVYDRAKRSINSYENDNYLKVKDFLSNSTHSYNLINKKPTTVNIDFFAHNRHFNLRLYPDLKSVFSDKLAIVDPEGKELNVNLDHIYSGYLEDDEHFSKVYGHVVNGIFEGKIHSKNGTYYVERANRYLPAKKKNVHSVIYDSKDVVHPHSDHFEGGCMDQETKEWMERISRSAVEDDHEEYNIKSLDNSQLNSKDLNKFKYETTNEQLCDHPKSRAKRQSDFFSSGIVNNYHPFFSNGYLDKGGRIRNPQHRISLNPRDRGPYSSKPFLLYSPTSSADNLKRRACSLYIQTDTFLWNHIRKDVDSDSKAREEISSLVAQHIKAVNHIYENTDFGGYRGLKFIVQRLKINDSSACDSSIKRKTNPFCSPNIDVSNFLNLNSQFNHDDFCLAYIFTYRDFSGGTLGLAWVASTSGASGGICEKYKSYTENVHGTQVQTKRSLNTGIITFVNYNSRVPPKVSELTLAHEIGHNFGSPHDYPTECRPGGVTGNYIMYSSATSGERLNNNKFSICSLRNISTVLNSVFKEEGKINCFQEDEGPFCGNKIVEENEECDCGYDSKECSETCCYPKDNPPEDPVAKSCTRPKGILCSPSEGPCCNEQCKFERNSKQCRAESECTYESVCSGIGAQCPLPRPKSNNTECNSGTQVCLNGQCIGSICLKYNLEECFLTSKNGARPEEMCEVACQRGNDASTCKRTSEIESMKKISGLKLRPGSPCNDFQGYCDIFQKCRAVDAEGPLAQLKNLLLNQKTLLSIKQWVTKNWWACIVIGLSVVMFMAAFIKCCAVHTPSSNPKKRPAVRISDTLRHPADTLRRKRHRSNQSRQNNNHRSNGNGSNANNSSNNATSNIPLQPTAPPLPTQYPSQAYQQTQLTVALPPESTITFTSTSNRTMNEPPPPYPGFGPILNPYKTSIVNTQQPPPLPPPRPNSITNQNLININSSGAGSINSATSSTNSSNNLLPSRGYGEGRGHYNRKGQSNVPTKLKQTQPVSSTSSNKQSSKTNNKKNSKK